MCRTLLIVDDHPAFRESASALLAEDGFLVVGTAADGVQAILQTLRLHPDVVLLDVQLPDLDGFAVARLLLDVEDPPCVVMTSSRDAAEYGPELPAAGTHGFIGKRALSGAALAGLLGRPHVSRARDAGTAE